MSKTKKIGLKNVKFRKMLPPVKMFLSTGVTLLDLAIANQLPGGFPAGRVSQIWGLESTAKTPLLAEALGSAQRQGGKALLIDKESTLDFNRAALFGIDLQKLLYDAPETLEEVFDKCLAGMLRKLRDKATRPSAIGVDSLSSLPSLVELGEALDKTGWQLSRPKILSKAFRKYDEIEMNRKKLAFIFIDQARDNIGVSFGDPLRTSGGRAAKFYISVAVRLSRKGYIRNKKGLPIGIIVKFVVNKNKVGPPMRMGQFQLLFDYGIDDVAINLTWLKEQRGKKKGPFFFKRKYKNRSLAKVVKFVEDNDLEDDLALEVEKVWKKLYALPERKRRKR